MILWPPLTKSQFGSCAAVIMDVAVSESPALAEAGAALKFRRMNSTVSLGMPLRSRASRALSGLAASETNGRNAT
eukprot:5589752-Alexandrium_andersonii.AAC.1